MCAHYHYYYYSLLRWTLSTVLRLSVLPAEFKSTCSTFSIGTHKLMIWLQHVFNKHSWVSACGVSWLFCYLSANPFHGYAWGSIRLRSFQVPIMKRFENTAGHVLVWNHFIGQSLKLFGNDDTDTHVRFLIKYYPLRRRAPLSWPFSGSKHTASVSTTSVECKMGNDPLSV